MASSSALERAESRLLQPIYNALDTRNVAAGLRACTQVIPRLRSRNVKHAAMAIKAHLLVLSKKRTEGSELVDEIRKEPVDSEDALGYLRVALTTLGRADEIAALYEGAFERAPQTGSIGLQLCMTYVRSSDWQGVQKTAFRLRSLLPDDPRPYSWSIFALLAQGLASPSPAESKPLFTLARALLKSPAARSTESPSHVWLKVRVLLGLADASADDAGARGDALREAWEFLESNEVKRVAGGNLEVDLVRWDVVKSLGEADADVWLSEWASLRSRIAGTEGVPSEDNFQLYLNLIALTSLLRKSDSDLHEETKNLFVELSERNEGKDRGPWIALLELEKKSSSDRDTAALAGYFDRFGSKPCCFEDLRPYLPTAVLPVQSFKEHLKAHLGPDATSLNDVRVQANALKFLQHLSSPSDLLEAEWIVERCKDLYVKGLPFGKNLNKDELQPVDDLVIIIVNVLVRDWSSSNDVKHLLQAVILLENAQKASTMNHYFRLLLIRLYRLLAAPSLAKPCYQTLKIDHVQHDTLSHFLLTRASTFAVGDGLDSDPSSLLTLTGKGVAWFKQTIGADAEQLVLALSNEVYPQVEDMSAYFRRLSTSLQRQVLQLEYTKQVLLPVGGALEVDTARAIGFGITGLPRETLADNRDFRLVPSYQPHGEPELEKLLDAGPRVDVVWVERMHAAYMRVLGRADELRTGARTAPVSSFEAPPDASSMTLDERAFLSFVDALVLWSHEAAEAPAKTQPPTDNVRAFFVAQADALGQALQDDGGRPWVVLHHAAVALDGFALLTLLIRALPPSKTRSLADQVGAVLKALAARLKQHAERAGSAKTAKDARKALPALGSAGVPDAHLAASLAELGASKRAALAGLAKVLLDAVAAAAAAAAAASSA